MKTLNKKLETALDIISFNYSKLKEIKGKLDITDTFNDILFNLNINKYRINQIELVMYDKDNIIEMVFYFNSKTKMLTIFDKKEYKYKLTENSEKEITNTTYSINEELSSKLTKVIKNKIKNNKKSL